MRTVVDTLQRIDGNVMTALGKMKNWKIGVRLGASLAITLLLMIVLASVGIWRIHQLQVISDVVYESGENSTIEPAAQI